MNQHLKLDKDWFSKPGDSLKLLMRRRGMTFEQVASELSGGEQTLRDIFGGAAEIGENTATELVKIFGGSHTYWVSRQSLYNRSLDEAVQEAATFEPEQWLDSVPDPITGKNKSKKDLELHAQLRRRLSYFNVPTFDGWFEQYGKYASQTPFRESVTFQSNQSLKLLWLRRGELEADLITTKPWDPATLRRNLPQIIKLTRISKPHRFLPKLKELLASAGVALVVVKSPKNCHVSGAARMVAPAKAMLLVSFRYRSDDQFWFTVFHEIGHLLLHEGQTFVDDDHSSDVDIEVEANQFAGECIIPSHAAAEFRLLKCSRSAVLRFSTKLGISPGLVVGQLQHYKIISPRQLNGIRRHWKWEDINPAEI